MIDMIDDRSGVVKPRSLVFDLLGDYVRHYGGEIRLRALVAIAEELGVAGSTIRVVAGRLRDEGWLDVRKEGRESIYTLTPKLLGTLDVGDRRLFRSEVRPWDGRWSMVIYTVPENDRRTRDQLRKKLAWLGFGPLAPATWICPHDRLEQAATDCADLPSARLDLLTILSSGLASDRALVERCWDLAPLNREYEQFIRAQRQNLARYQQGHLDGATAQAHRIKLLNTYRRFPFRDPDLPPELQPAGWVGDQARDLFLQIHALLLEPAQRHYAEVVARYTPSMQESERRSLR